MSVLRRALLLSALLSGLSTAASAQTQTEPIPEGQPTQATTLLGDRPWTFTAGAGVVHDSNVLLVDQEGAGDVAGSLDASLARHWTLRRGDVRVSGNVSQLYYRDNTELDSFRYDIGGNFSYMLTRRLTWSLGTSTTSGLAQDARVLTDAGVVLPAVTARTTSTATAFGYQLTPKSQLTWALSQQGVGFKGALFAGGQTFSSTVTYSRQLYRSQTISVSQGYQRQLFDDSPAGGDSGSATVQSYLATWTNSLGRIWSVHVTGGVRPYTIPEEEGYKFAPGTSAGVSMRVREGHTLSVSYDYTIEQAFGLNRTHLVQTVAGNYAFVYGRRLSADLGASYSRGTYPLLPDMKLVGSLFSGSLIYRLVGSLAVSVSSGYYVREVTPQPSIGSVRTRVNVFYAAAWR